MPETAMFLILLLIATVIAIVLLLALVACANAAKLVVFGDSWGTEGARSLNKVLVQQHGITVDNVAVGGTTTKTWAGRPTFLRDTVAKNPDAKWVWLTIGGNDAKDELPKGIPIDQLVHECINRTKIFLDPLFAAYPNIRVLQFGYDILTFSKGIICPALGEIVLPKCKLNATCINSNFLQLQFGYVEALNKLYPNHDSVNILGTMQAAGHVAGASVGHPNLAHYSPDQYMQSNCIHPNDAGFEIIFNQLWSMYFSKF